MSCPHIKVWDVGYDLLRSRAGVPEALSKGVGGGQCIPSLLACLLPRTAELVCVAAGVTDSSVTKARIAESLFPAMRREIESAQLDFPTTGGVCKA